MINHKEGQELNIHKALIEKAIEYAKRHNINKIEGPNGASPNRQSRNADMGLTIHHKSNFDYYPQHLEQLGLVKEKEWVEFELAFPEVLSEKVIKFNDLIKEKYQLKVLKFNNKKEILPLVEPMFQLLDETYKGLSTYTPITQQQIQTYKEKYFGFIDKDFIVCITDANDKLISFAITMPSYSKALQKANGKLSWMVALHTGK
ncbi:hypothetical protein FQR65_LT18985 [Abscondita terminalis]|nr:hypothetical protein FQR65_LT18985 [Abscondita terminalis]